MDDKALPKSTFIGEELLLREQILPLFKSRRPLKGPSKGFGELGRKAIYFQALGSTSNYFQGAGKQALNFWKQKSSVRMSFSNLFLALGGYAP